MKVFVYASKEVKSKIANSLKEVSPEINIVAEIKDCDIVINLFDEIPVEDEVFKLSEKYCVDMKKATSLLNLISFTKVKASVDEMAKEIDKIDKKPLVINATSPIDLVTIYLHKVYGIISYGLSLKGANLVDDFLIKTGLLEYIGKVKSEMAGVNNNLWITDIKTLKGEDLYPKARESVKDLDLRVTRNDLTRDALRCLKFFHYYHSANVESQDNITALKEFISAYIGLEEKRVCLNKINCDSLSDFDSFACVEIPFKVGNKTITAEQVSLPIQCALAINDYISASLVAVKALALESKEIFKRFVKLEPYLMSILTLKELDDLANDVTDIVTSLSVFK
ncbi:MAG TPA: hypothetical protein PKX91_02195 [Clostridia bacterium]|jgi:alpha-galactosidase/6-phospho-beta-glucosidase family protein|nr:hypothetical protein [Clostridia bacterium]